MQPVSASAWGGPPPPPARRRRPIIVIAAGLLALLLIVVVVAIASSGGGDDLSDPNAVAEQFVDAINTGDVAAAEAVLCDGALLTPGSVEEIVASEPSLRLSGTLEDYVEGMSGSDSAKLEGSVAGAPAVGDIWVGEPEAPGPWCVMSATVLPDPDN